MAPPMHAAHRSALHDTVSGSWLSVTMSEMASRYGMSFAVRDCAVDFRRPARLDDLIEVRSWFVELAGATVSAVQAVWRGTEELVRIEVRVACLRGDGRPARIPAVGARFAFQIRLCIKLVDDLLAKLPGFIQQTQICWKTDGLRSYRCIQNKFPLG